MKTLKARLYIAMVVCLFAVSGCKQESPTTSPTPTAAEASAPGDKYGYNHPQEGETDHSVAGHSHGAGPHDGTIADWGGGKYHVEFTVNHEKQEATVYVLGGDEKTPSPIAVEEIELITADPEMIVALKAAPQEGDPEGSASRFVGQHEKLSVAQEYEGTITGVIDGTPYAGDFTEHAHDHE